MADIQPAVPPPPPIEASIGIIFPPSDIRGIIDKTASFVAKNGTEFEQRVLREQSSQRFAFLQHGNPYRPYYEMKVREGTTGEVEATAPAVPQAVLNMKNQEAEKAKKKQTLLMLTQHTQSTEDLKPPDPDLFIMSHPPIAPVDIDVVKVTAQYAARNGQKFLVSLTQRERHNPQFEFLQPSHHVFKYFISLVDVYSKCLLPDEKLLSRLQENASPDSISKILERAYRRHQWEAQVEKERKEKEKLAEEERMQIHNIDWHDFIVVETIDFTEEDENTTLPEPIDFFGDLPRTVPAPMGEKPSSPDRTKVSGQEASGDFDMHNGEAPVIPHSPPPDDVIASARPPTVGGLVPGLVPDEVHAPPTTVPSAPATAPTSGHTGTQPLVVVTDYVRQPKRRQVGAAKLQRCPITGSLVPAADMSNHLRILLLDPAWKEQKDKLLDKAKKESAFAPEFDVEGNLANFVARRPDLFGSVEDEIQEHTVESFTGYDEASAKMYEPSRGSGGAV